MTAPAEREVMDEVVLRMLDEQWRTAAEVAEMIGWQTKSVVWCLTRLRASGRLVAQIVYYRSDSPKARRGSGENRYVYRSLSAMPQWLSPQGLRGKG